MIRTKAVVLAKRHHRARVAYANNDLPGTMLAGAALTYITRYGVRPERAAVVFANNDSARTLLQLAFREAGIPIAAIVDPRAGVENSTARWSNAPARQVLRSVTVLVITCARGRRRVSGVEIVSLCRRRFDIDRLRSRRAIRRLQSRGASFLAGARLARIR